MTTQSRSKVINMAEKLYSRAIAAKYLNMSVHSVTQLASTKPDLLPIVCSNRKGISTKHGFSTTFFSAKDLENILRARIARKQSALNVSQDELDLLKDNLEKGIEALDKEQK